MIDATIKLATPADKRKEILQTLTVILGPIRREPGCISCHCYVDIEDQNLIFMREEWTTKRSLDTHLRSPLFGVLIGAMKLLNDEPEISFNSVAPREVNWR